MQMKRLEIGLLMLMLTLMVSAKVKPRIPKPARQQTVQEYQVPWRAPMRIGSQSSAPLSAFGVQKVPVVLVQFNDLKFTVESTPDDVNVFYDKFCNGTMDGVRYTGAGSYGAVRDYFIDQSYGMFTPEFVVIGPVTLNNGYAYYGGNNAGGNDMNRAGFVRDALVAAHEIYSDWSEFDNDGDGVLDFVFYIYAGEGENGSDDPNTIWPHESTSQKTIGDMKVGAYGCCNELYQGVADGIGIMCHELSHALGLPDIYDLDGQEYGMDYWDLMDSGCYCKDGYHPCGYSAYEKEFMGWRPLTTLIRDREVSLTLTPVSEGGVGYRIPNPENSYEYYILENRQNTGWDTYIARGTEERKRHGLLVTHVDYSASKWASNRLNTDANHQHYTIIPADGTKDSYSLVNNVAQYEQWAVSADGDLFPGIGNVTCLSARKQPVWTASGTMGQPFTNIREHEDGTITLTICLFADVNFDGIADTQDVLDVYHYMGVVEAQEKNVSEDVNRDYIVDTQDVLKVYERMNDE